MPKKKEQRSLREHLIAKYHAIEEEMVEIYQHQKMWRELIKFTLLDSKEYACQRSREFAEMINTRLTQMQELDKQIENLTPEQEKYDDLIYSIVDVTNCVTKNVPMDMHSFSGFMILLTANIGELQGRIESLPDSIEWKKDALDKLNHLLEGETNEN